MIKIYQMKASFIISRIKLYVYTKYNPDSPWITRQSIELLKDLIKPSDTGLEFGSGRSTSWFASRCKSLVSVEHSSVWFEKVKLDLLNYDNVDYRFCELNPNPEKSSYYLTINEFEDKYFDFIVIDGKYRDILALKAIGKLKSSGILIIDNAERSMINNFKTFASIGQDSSKMTDAWKDFMSKTKMWRKIWTTDGISTTLILFKI